MDIGLVGCGAIGTELAREITRRLYGKARLIGIYDKNEGSKRTFQKRLGRRIPSYPLARLIDRSQLVIEAASPEAVGEILPLAIRRRRATMLLSTGGLLLYPRLFSQAQKAQLPLYLPSGAIGGIDVLKAAAAGKIRSITLTTRKPPRALGQGALRKPRQIFAGSARQAIARFPQNINVAATLSLASRFSRVNIRIIADPGVTRNIHEVEALGDFGRVILQLENHPSRQNPKTSRLAILSAVATLRQMVNPLKVGT